jgi:hypothetical protein
MAKGRESFDRRQRERAKKAKADAKRQRRWTKDDEESEENTEEEATAAAKPVDEGAVLGALAKLHEAFEQERIGFDEFEEQRSELLARLQIP